MLTPLTYAVPANGPTTAAPAAYYWFGIGGAGGTKFRNGTATPEAGFLSGLQSTVAGSNLAARSNAYYGFGPSRTTRFSSASATFANFVGLWGKNRAVFPVFNGWQVFGTPNNAT